MDIVEAFATKNRCYQAGAPLRPQGLMLHSIGTPQPSAAALARYFDQYQPGGQSVCVHGFIQRDGTYYQTLPYTMRAWHCGGAANATHIGVEMTEPGAGMTYAEAAEQIAGTYHAAVELFAQLCEMYSLDPLADGVIIGHAEDTGAAWPATTPTRNIRGMPMAWASPWTGSAKMFMQRCTKMMRRTMRT